MTESGQHISGLRDRLTEIDRQILALVAERQQVVERIGSSKRAAGQDTRDFRREKEVIEGAIATADRLGVPTELAEALLRMLIRSSLTTQERARVVAEGRGSGRKAMVIGGAGRMGAWFADFLASQGYDVEVADPVEGDGRYPQRKDWQAGPLDQDVIVVATPLEISSRVLDALAEHKPAGLIFDVGSLKSPLRDSLRNLVAAGCRATSIHPMFGPDTQLLSGRHVIFIDVGCREATEEAKALFEATMAERAEMALDEHDRLIAYVLGLSHALNIAFFTALAESGEDVPHLEAISSTTFDAQLAVSSRVADENPWLYYEIQALNDYGREPLDALERSVTSLVETIREGDADGFVALMQRGRDYLVTRRAPDPA